MYREINLLHAHTKLSVKFRLMQSKSQRLVRGRLCIYFGLIEPGVYQAKLDWRMRTIVLNNIPAKNPSLLDTVGI